MLDRLAKLDSTVEKSYGDFGQALRQFGKTHFFLLENTIYCLKDEFVHPGGQFILPRIDRGHITKYYYGISALKNMQFPNMTYLHTEPIPSDICKEKFSVPTSGLWVKKHPNLMMTTSTWKKDFSWRVLKVIQLSKVHIMFHVRPKNVMIETEEMRNAVRNFGKILLCQLKHHSDFKYSFLHLSSFDEFVNNRKKFYHTILNKSPVPAFQKAQTRPLGFLANFNPSRKIDVIASEIQNKFAKKYFNEMFADVTDSVANQDYLPIILKLKDSKKFLDTLSRTEAEDIKAQFIKKSDEPVELSSKIKMALGGPFGWENILEEGRETVLFLDSDSIYAMDDTAYALLQSMYVVLTSQNPEEITEHRKRLSVKLHIIFRTKANKMDTMTEFLLAFYFYEQITRSGFLKSLFVFSNDALLKNYIGDNSYAFATAHRHIICAKYKHAYAYYKNIKKLVNKNNIMFV